MEQPSIDAAKTDRNIKFGIFVGFVLLARLTPPLLRKVGF
jgi:hypothetical protein